MLDNKRSNKDRMCSFKKRNMCCKFLFVFALIGFVTSKDLPSYLQNLKCKRDGNFKTCVINNGNKAIPLVARGDPEYHIPKLNPMELPFVNLISSPNLKLNLTNTRIYGLENLKIIDTSSRILKDKGFSTMTLKGENLTISGQYSVDGNVLIMPIKGNGHFTMFLKNGVYKVTNTMTFIDKKGDLYYNPLEVRLEYTFEKIEFQLNNLFNGNKQLGDQVNRFLNENWDLVVADVGPGIGNIISSLILRIYKAFTSVVPMKNFIQS